MQYVEILNEKQKKAVEHVEGPFLVLAGAGSGKTRVVTHRIAHLLEIGIPASEILAVTFTNKAAEVMRERVKALTNQNVLTCTFHSLAARILRESIHEIGYQNTFAIYDAKDSENLLKNCLEMLGLKDDKSLLKAMRHEISEAKNDLITPEEVADKRLQSVYHLYQMKLKEYNALDFDDLLFLTIELFQKSPEAKKYQERWSFVLIDEYQDTNQAQYRMSRFLVEKHRNLFVVGDPDQSIYSWRGANINNILNFENDFPGGQTITLDENYRSTNTILQAANALIGNNLRSFKKDLWSGLGDGEKVQMHLFRNDREETEFVVDAIRKYGQKIPLEEIVIFYRTNSQSRIFEDQLLKYRIPYTIVGGLSFYQRREIKDILAYLRLILSPADFLSFERVINLPKRGIGPTALDNIINAAPGPILDTCQKIVKGEITCKLSKRQESGLLEFCNLIDQCRKMVENKKPIHEVLKEIIYTSRYLDYLKEEKESYEDRKGNVEELIGKAMQWECEAEKPTLESFLEELSLKSSTDEGGSNKSSIRLMTLHSGKGMEFDVCFIVGMEEDLFPHLNSKDSYESVEEERRLCYVGMTRAKKHLHLSAAKYRILWGTPRNQRPSRFLREIPDRYVEKRCAEAKEEQEGEIEEGSTVFHKDFGQGIVKQVYETSLGLTYDIHFPDDNSKRSLVAKYAKLRT